MAISHHKYLIVFISFLFLYLWILLWQIRWIAFELCEQDFVHIICYKFFTVLRLLIFMTLFANYDVVNDVLLIIGIKKEPIWERIRLCKLLALQVEECYEFAKTLIG